MESNISMRGQASVEFVFTILIAVLFIMVIINPSVDFASKSTEDVANISKLWVAGEKISNAIQYASLSGSGTKQTISIVVPKDATITCDTTEIVVHYTSLSYAEGQPIEGCVGADCEYIFDAKTEFTCHDSPVDPIATGRILSVEIEKPGSTINVTFSE